MRPFLVVAALAGLLSLAPLASPGSIVYDEIRTYAGSGSRTFDRYSPPSSGFEVDSVIVKVVGPAAPAVAYDNENDFPVEIWSGGGSTAITVSSSDVLFAAIHHVDSPIASVLMLGPHDDPDGIDTLDSYQADSGSDCSQLLAVLPLVLSREVSDDMEVASFMGTGTFDIDLLLSGTGIAHVLPTGVSTTEGGLVSIGYSVRVTMIASEIVPVPEPTTLCLAIPGLLLLLRRRRRA